MELTEFTSYLVKNIVKNPDMVKVSVFESDEDSKILEIIVASSDMGAIIGKNGTNAHALKTIILAYAYLHNVGKVKVNIDAF